MLECVPNIFEEIVQKIKLQKKYFHSEFEPFSLLHFTKIKRQSNHLADIIESNLDKLTKILLEYESHEVVQDEIGRTLDLLRHLEENKEFFKLRSGAVVAFLPRNQPLYAFSCFVVVPALMASEVHFRIPHSMKRFFPQMLEVLDIKNLFPNIIVSSKDRTEFLRERSAILVNPKTKESKPVTDVIIFTGRPSHADRLRLIFDKRTLFILNGAGHNPVVVSSDADVTKVVEAVLTLQFYNQGQDCAAPNAILVHSAILSKFLDSIRKRIRHIKVGHYHDKTAQIGPISEPKALVEIQEFLIENSKWLDPATPGIIHSRDAIIEPTIISKPLIHGGNFKEIFAPIVFVQEYEQDNDLSLYFEDQRYAPYAMYVTVYGTSAYVESIIGHPIAGKVLHERDSLIHNTHLHAHGIERGVKSYGGHGYSASSICINGKITPKPTLPQRDIYEQVLLPYLRKKKTAKELQNEYRHFTDMKYKNVEKLLKLRVVKEEIHAPLFMAETSSYLDVGSLKLNGSHFMQIDEENIYSFLENPNAEHIVSLNSEEVKSIRSLNDLLARKNSLDLEEFTILLYSISKKSNGTDDDDKKRQRQFFQHVYYLLFGKNSGPRLSSFLWEINDPKISKLLNV